MSNMAGLSCAEQARAQAAEGSAAMQQNAEWMAAGSEDLAELARPAIRLNAVVGRFKV